MKDEITLELTSADIPGALSALTGADVTLSSVTERDGLTVRLTILRQDLDTLRTIAEKRGDSIKQISRFGLTWRLRPIGRHPLLLLGILMILVLTVWLPTRVLFFRVEGNNQIPARLILEKASQCGITFGAERGEVRSERMKNALLDTLPQLQWAGINTYGCVAVITVEERSTPHRFIGPDAASMVAVRDGLIREVTVTRGTALCQVGQSVRAGEVLISGYTDCGGTILAQRAEGEVYAETMHQMIVLTAPNLTSRGDLLRTVTKISLILGKKRINFYEDSGILDTTCVKMYSEYYMTLPGGLTLPVTLVLEEWRYYDTTNGTVSQEQEERILTEYSRDYLHSRMVAGQILTEKRHFLDDTLFSEYICLEMIGRIRYEENTDIYGENYGTNSQR